MKKMRSAIALLELIFSIVIIAITLISVPNLIKTTSNASKEVITQESVSNASSYANMIMSSFWDENCSDPKYENPILYVQKEDANLKELNSSGILLGRRIGSAQTTPRRFRNDLSGNRLSASDTLQKEASDGEPDDVDDFNNRSVNLVQREATSVAAGEYKDISVALASTVNYINDKADNGYNKQTVTFNNPFDSTKIETQSTNIKLITVTLKSTNDPSKKIVLRAFSCNIGSSKLKERLFN